MEDRSKERNWLSVPQFGDWEQKGGEIPDYSLDFSKIREMRKQHKRGFSNEQELAASATATNVAADPVLDAHPPYHQNHSPIVRRGILSYFNCCVKA